ncbi:uncharacterized protein LOC112461514 [Temnothorax curvispinosus]|uniref:Uncharacterized protein LOC112461514 n=1 Tax=Temnothorax curvispinosus TaxID=300111 RepID=A0A6J1QPS8_9HYME|nr:uncharacterized protein LOC112461514 [Temnothorax curvispinosus]
MPKDIRYLSKTRKNQLINYKLHCHEDPSLLQSVVRNIALSVLEAVDEAVDESVDEAVNIGCISYGNVTDLNGLDALLESQSHVERKHEEPHIESQNDTPVTLEDVIDCMDETTLRTDLQRLIMEDVYKKAIFSTIESFFLKLIVLYVQTKHLEIEFKLNIT